MDLDTELASERVLLSELDVVGVVLVGDAGGLSVLAGELLVARNSVGPLLAAVPVVRDSLVVFHGFGVCDVILVNLLLEALSVVVGHLNFVDRLLFGVLGKTEASPLLDCLWLHL